MDNLYNIHLGIVRDWQDHLVLDESVPANGQEINLSAAGGDFWTGHVDGSWQTWGPEDEPIDSVHVVVTGLERNCVSHPELRVMRDSLARVTNGRVLDYALVTTEDDSEKVALFTFDTGTTYTYTVRPGLNEGFTV